MHGDPAAAADSDSANLSFFSLNTGIYPYTGFPCRATRVYSIFLQSKYDNLFHIPQIFSNICIKFFEVKNRITHDLLWAMKSNIAAAVGPKKINSSCFEVFFT